MKTICGFQFTRPTSSKLILSFVALTALWTLATFVGWYGTPIEPIKMGRGAASLLMGWLLFVFGIYVDSLKNCGLYVVVTVLTLATFDLVAHLVGL